MVPFGDRETEGSSQMMKIDAILHQNMMLGSGVILKIAC
jgi:hypothetical protein